jgi:hypothetical protein
VSSTKAPAPSAARIVIAAAPLWPAENSSVRLVPPTVAVTSAGFVLPPTVRVRLSPLVGMSTSAKTPARSRTRSAASWLTV